MILRWNVTLIKKSLGLKMSKRAFLRNARLKKENFLNMGFIITLSLNISWIKKGRLKSALEKSLLSGYFICDMPVRRVQRCLSLHAQHQASHEDPQSYQLT